jgi:maleylacetoacetate isomerase
MPSLTLYNYWRSSSSHRVRIVLALKGVPYEYEAVDLYRGEHSGSAHRERSPTGYVPCLVIDGVSYVESVAIVELLDETFPDPPLYPRTAHGRARVRALVEIVNSGIQPMQNLAVSGHARATPEEQKEWSRHFVARGLAAFEAAMRTADREGVRGRFAYGDAPTAADAFLVPQVLAAKRFGVDLSALPAVSRAFDAAMELAAFQAAAPEKQPDAPKTATA